MRAEHLTPDELEALVRDEETEPDVRQHVEVCAECRESAREEMFATRYVRPLSGDHPDEHVLTALWSNALSPARKKDVKRHVATCSRCRALLERLVRATPPESSPSLVRDGVLKDTEAWAANSTAPRRATIVVREAHRWAPLEASFVPNAEGLQLLKPNPPALSDGRLGLRFRPFREGAAIYLAVYRVKSPAGLPIPPIPVTLTASGGASRHAEINAGVEAILKLSPGTSRLVIEARPRWEIEVRFDA